MIVGTSAEVICLSSEVGIGARLQEALSDWAVSLATSSADASWKYEKSGGWHGGCFQVKYLYS